MAKRGLFAELNYQNKQAEARKRQHVAAVARERATATRAAEKAQLAFERAMATASKADAATQREALKVAASLHLESKAAEVVVMNTELDHQYREIDEILLSALLLDEHVDLESLKITTVEHPPFDAGGLDTPHPAVPELTFPPEPIYSEPSPAKGLSAAFGGKKRHEAAVVQARTAHEETVATWRVECGQRQADHAGGTSLHGEAERSRTLGLAGAHMAYQRDCQEREAEAEARNAEVSKFINDLAFDVESAIYDYVGVVLSTSTYPDAFPVTYEHQFNLETRELHLTVTLPDPTKIPVIKEYRYMKAKDEIVSVALSVRDQKERYANAVWQVALRSMHEIFKADQAGKIHSIALRVNTAHIVPATGQPEALALAVVAADRETFGGFDLGKVLPQATLLHLGAALSKSPFDMTPADTSAGVRPRGK